ncbi:MAG: integrase arm-type DNA-binding domain-containing protein [Rhodoplanes sp.]
MAKGNGVPITKRVVDSSQPTDRRYYVWDSDLAGFGLRVETSGAKTFIVRYRADGGGRSAAQRFVTVGRFGKLTAEQARKQAKTILGSVATGEDPAGERRAKRREMKVSDLIDLYEVEGCFVQRGIRQGEAMKERTKAYTIARLKHHVVPLLGHKRVSEIGAGEIERFVRDVSAGKTARDEKTGPRKRIIVRGGDGAARKVVRDLSAVFSFAVRRCIVQENPVDRASIRKSDNRRQRFLTMEEVTRLGAAFESWRLAAPTQRRSPSLGCGLLQAVDGTRSPACAGLKWTPNEASWFWMIRRPANRSDRSALRPWRFSKA